MSSYYDQRERFRLYEPNAAAYARYRREVQAYEHAFLPAPVWARLGAALSTAIMVYGATGPWLAIELPREHSHCIRGVQTDGFFVAMFGVVAVLLLCIALLRPETEVPAAFALGADAFCAFIAFICVFFLKSFRPGIIGVAPSSIALGWGVYLTAGAGLIATAFAMLVVRRSATF